MKKQLSYKNLKESPRLTTQTPWEAALSTTAHSKPKIDWTKYTDPSFLSPLDCINQATDSTDTQLIAFLSYLKVLMAETAQNMSSSVPSIV